MAEQRPTPAERIGRAVIDLRRNPYNRAIQRWLYSVGDHELTPVQVDILETVAARPGQLMSELAEALGVDASTVSRTVRPLIDLALVERRPGAQDRRQAQLFPTAAGSRQVAQIDAARRAMMAAVQSHFAPERIELFAALLEDYIRAVTIEGRRILDGEGEA